MVAVGGWSPKGHKASSGILPLLGLLSWAYSLCLEPWEWLPSWDVGDRKFPVLSGQEVSFSYPLTEDKVKVAKEN